MENILDNIFQIRSKLGFSQEYMANELGVKQSGYAMIEKGKRELKFNTLIQIAKIFKMPVVDIITYPNKYVDSNQSLEEAKKTRVCIELDLDENEDLNKALREKVLKMLK
jgi:transcriptional regulator with XRE-family HTH domain